MNSTPFRVGIIGAGAIAELHAAAVAHTGHRVVAVCDVREAAANTLASAYEARSYTDHRRLLADAGVDGVIITVPHALHASIALDAIAAGTHALIEKPLAVRADEARRIIAASRAAGVTVAVGHVLHFMPTLVTAEELIRSGEIGTPVLLSEQRASDYSEGSRPAWFFDPDIAGGGILMNVGTHAIDRIRWLGGSPIVRAHGFVAARPGSRVETEATSVFELGNGAHASLTLGGTGLPFTEIMSVVGETGALTIERGRGVRLFERGVPRHTITPDKDEIPTAFADQLLDFVHAATSGTHPRVGAQHGLEVLAVAQAVYDSARLGEPVEVRAHVAEGAPT
ncbi:hypothetical protein GCM10028784_25920 [Myceligenerans cantabricum]